ncbi:MAG: hypothetical protein P4N59_04725 [Negativicutes bacterium]|nr:hypothetical protein [Negativicutes bacterium]
MNIHFFLKLFSALVSVGMTISSLAQTNDAPAFTVNGHIAGIQLSLAFDKTMFTNNEEIGAWSVVTNLTDTPMNVPPSRIGMGLGLTVRDANNQPLAQIVDGHGKHISGPMTVSLPGHSCISNYIVISKLYNLKPGSYSVSAKQEMSLHPPWGSNSITSQAVTINVTSNPY